MIVVHLYQEDTRPIRNAGLSLRFWLTYTVNILLGFLQIYSALLWHKNYFLGVNRSADAREFLRVFSQLLEGSQDSFRLRENTWASLCCCSLSWMLAVLIHRVTDVLVYSYWSSWKYRMIFKKRFSLNFSNPMWCWINEMLEAQWRHVYGGSL